MIAAEWYISCMQVLTTAPSPLSPQVIAAEWYIPPNNSELTSGGKYPNAIDHFLETFTVPDASDGL